MENCGEGWGSCQIVLDWGVINWGGQNGIVRQTLNAFSRYDSRKKGRGFILFVCGLGVSVGGGMIKWEFEEVGKRTILNVICVWLVIFVLFKLIYL